MSDIFIIFAGAKIAVPEIDGRAAQPSTSMPRFFLSWTLKLQCSQIFAQKAWKGTPAKHPNHSTAHAYPTKNLPIFQSAQESLKNLVGYRVFSQYFKYRAVLLEMQG
jgi:hypothetical protein